MTPGRCPILLLILTLLPSSAEATKLVGKALDSGLGGPPMTGVQIGAAGTNPTTTGNLGLFTLDFPKRQPGDAVELTVAKDGYLVVNDVQLQAILPRVAEDHPLTLLLCKPQACEEMRRRFYRLKGIEAVEESYKRQLAKLEQRNQATAAERDRLRQERDEALAAAEKAAEDFARISPEKDSDMNREARRLFVEGRLDQALAVLDEAKLQSKLEAARIRQKAAAREIEEVTQSYLLRGHLLTVQLKFDEAERAYEAAVAGAPASFQANSHLAYFLDNQKRYFEATAAYQRCLELARTQGSAAKAAWTLNNLGNVLSRQKRLDEAREAYNEALDIRRQLKQKGPDVYLSDIAETLNNLGILLNQQNRLDEARKAYDEALDIRRLLAQKHPAVYLSAIAETLNNLGVLLSAQNRLDEARKDYDEALNLYRLLAQKHPDVYLPDLAMTLHNLGLLDFKEERWSTARKVIKEALKIRRDLAADNPSAFLSEVADTLFDLALLNRQDGRTDEAQKAAEEALAVYAPFVAQNPGDFEEKVYILNLLLDSLDAPD